MATFDVDVGGATYRVDAPDENTAWQWANVTHAQQPDPIDQSARNFAQDMPRYEQALAGTGKALTDTWRGIKQRFNIGDQTQLQQQIDESRKLDAPLMKTIGGVTGNIAGSMLPILPTAAIPGVNTIVGAGALGAGIGALSPTATGESPYTNAAVGAGLGAGGQAIGSALARLIKPVESSLGPEASRLAGVAKSEGIPLSAAQETGSKPLQLTESVLSTLPFTSADEIAKKQAQKAAFNRAALLRAGISGETAATPDVLLAQKQALGKTFEDISGNNNLRLFTPAETPKPAYTDWQVVPQAAPGDRATAGVLDSIGRQANTQLPPEEATRVNKVIDQILSQTDKSGVLSGTNYQGWREPLRDLSLSGNKAEARYYGKIRKAMDNAFSEQLSGPDLEKWRKASQEYANLKTILDTMGRPGISQATGDIPPTQLGAALASSIGKENKALGRGDMNDLAKAGRLFVSDNLPDSGTAQRQFYRNLLTGQLGGATLGGLAGYSAGKSPESTLEGAAIGSAASLAGPKLAQVLLNSKAGQAYLKSNAISPAQRRAMIDLIRSGAIGSMGSIQGAQQ